MVGGVPLDISHVVAEWVESEGSSGLGVQDGALPWLAVGTAGGSAGAVHWSNYTLSMWLRLLVLWQLGSTR